MLLRLRARVKVEVIVKAYDEDIRDYVSEKRVVVGVLLAKYDVSTLTSKFTVWDIQTEDSEILRMVREKSIVEFPKEKDEQEGVDVVPSPETVEHG